MTEAYVNEAMELCHYKAEMEKPRARRSQLRQLAKDIELREQQEVDGRAVLKYIERFCRHVSNGLP